MSVALIVVTAVMLYFNYRELVNYYKTEFTPIPKYMVDEKDITAYNEKGEKIFVKNQSAYYRAVERNIDESDDNNKFDEIGVMGDLNGAVGKQWLALYYAKNEAETPILANSLKVVVDNKNIPAGYSTGIHMFGSADAENLNNPLYIWNQSAKSVFVYYKTESAPVTGSAFTAGAIAISGAVGLLLGAGIAVGVTFIVRKKKTAEVAPSPAE